MLKNWRTLLLDKVYERDKLYKGFIVKIYTEIESALGKGLKARSIYYQKIKFVL